ncbi:MAG: SIS domain-containing protein [Oscillospiraceae bacterium]|nr:SIS domain-containing protein [Oscillospiraceae bacterium]
MNLEKNFSDYLIATAEVIKKSDMKALSDIANKLIETKQNGGTVFTAGNGGSSATASHMVNDLTKGCRVHGREGFKAICLSDSSTLVTCLANDFSYEEAYMIELKTLGKKGDVLVVYSGSGNSPNVVKAAEYAQEAGIIVIGFLGRDGGKMKDLCDLYIIAPTDSMESLEDAHMAYEHALTVVMVGALEDTWGMEILKLPQKNRVFKSALFDFDGTLSLIREGWQKIMIPYFCELLYGCIDYGVGDGDMIAETKMEIKECVTDFVDKLTGKQTIFQCIQVGEEIKKRGGIAQDPMVYKTEYLRRLHEKIKDRKAGLRDGSIKPEELLVPGTVGLLEKLKESGLSVYCASGTDNDAVLEEAKLLGLDKYFGENIYGALDEHATECTKELVIKRILSENNITGEDLISFGDGYVEIELIVNIGGYSVAVATDEKRKKGIDEWKRNRLIQAGASAVIPDFVGADKIMGLVKYWE